MTAAQLQAQRDLARKEREVELAKLELSDFVGRKRALQRQIEFEEELAISDKKERENLLRARVAFKGRVEKAREAGASAEKIQRYERGNRELERVIQELEQAGQKRAEYIDSLEERLANLDESELQVTKSVDEAQEKADAERKRIAAKWKGHTGQVPWIIGFEDGMAEAKFSGKPVIVFFTATW